MPEHTTWVRPPSADTLKLNYLHRIEDLLKEIRDELKLNAQGRAAPVVEPKVRKVRKGYT